MGISLAVKGTRVNFELPEYGIVSFGFICEPLGSRLAKGADWRCLEIRGNITYILERVPGIVGQIREWGKSEYHSDDDYYHTVKVTEIYRNETVREITFQQAFVLDYKENTDPRTGQGYFTLLLQQKQDERTEIIVDPGNQVISKK